MKTLFAILSALLVSTLASAAPLNIKLPAAKVLKVQQYQDLMPTIVEPGMPVPNKVFTLVEIQYERCAAAPEDGFKIERTMTAKFQMLNVVDGVAYPDCFGPTVKRTMTLYSREFTLQQPIVALESVLVERLPDVY